MVIVLGCRSTDSANRANGAVNLDASGSEDEVISFAIDARGAFADVDLRTHPGRLSYAEGVVSYDSQGAYDSLAQGESVSAAFSFRVGQTPHEVTVTITGVNDSPRVEPRVLAAMPKETQARSELVLDVLALFTDIDHKDSVSFTSVTACDGASVQHIGDVVVFSTVAEGTCRVEVMVTDSAGATAVAQIDVLVRGGIISMFSMSRAWVAVGLTTVVTWSSSAVNCTLS